MPHAQRSDADPRSSREHLARLTSTLGAAVAGVGVGVLVADLVRGLGFVIVLLGAAVHAWGMFDGMRLEQGAGIARPRWSLALYWLCWLLLAALVLFVLRKSLQ